MIKWYELNLLECSGIATLLFLAIVGICYITYIVFTFSPRIRYMIYKLKEPFDPEWMKYDEWEETNGH